MTTRILLTGFTPYDGMAVNPTALLMQRAPAALVNLPDVQIKTVTVDTDYVQSEQQLAAAISDFRPDAVISFGLSSRIDGIHPERIAVNVDDAPIHDNSGQVRSGQKIAEDGPVGYWSTLPIEDIRRALAQAGMPVRISNHAGTYVCNHLLYFGLHFIATRSLETRMGFIHVPSLPEMVQDEPGLSGLSIDTLLDAARIIVATTAKGFEHRS